MSIHMDLTGLTQIAALVEGIGLLGLLIYCWQTEKQQRIDAQKKVVELLERKQQTAIPPAPPTLPP